MFPLSGQYSYQVSQSQQGQQTAPKIKREHTEDSPRRRKVARPHAGDTQLELDDSGSFHDRSETLPPVEREIIEID